MCDALYECEYIAYDRVMHICYIHDSKLNTSKPLELVHNKNYKSHLLFKNFNSCKVNKLLEIYDGSQTSTLVEAIPINSTETSKCIFPFFFSGTWITKCVYFDDDRTWCSLVKGQNISPYHPGKDWGFCVKGITKYN